MTAMMRPVTAIETAASAAERWRSQYQHWNDEDRYADGRTKGETNDALNSQQHTPENISRIINKGWAYPTCTCCGEYRDVVVTFTQPYSDDDFSLCHQCLDRAALILSQFPASLNDLSKTEGAGK